MDNALARTDERRNLVASPILRDEDRMSLQETMQLGAELARSEMFPSARNQAQAVAIILAGRELGLSPLVSLRGMNIIKGQIQLKAALLGGMIKSRPGYDYQVLRLDDEGAEVSFLRDGQEIGRHLFTMADARRAGLTSNDLYGKRPKNMLLARCLSDGAKWFTPEIFLGAVYDEGEIVVDPPQPQVDRTTGEVIDVRGRMSEPVQPVTTQRVADATEKHASYAEAANCPAGESKSTESHLARFRRLWEAAGRDTKSGAAYIQRVLGKKAETPEEWQRVADDFADHPQALKYAMKAYSETGADPDEDQGAVMRVEMTRILGLDALIASRRDCTAKELRTFGEACRKQELPAEAQQTVLEAELVEENPFESEPEHPRSALVTGA